MLARDGARKISEAVFPSLCDSVLKASTDAAFLGIDFSRYTPETFVVHVSLNGSPVQRAALARYLSPEAGYAFNGIFHHARTTDGLKRAIEFIGKMIKSLASHLGVQFSGELDSVSYTIIQDFGGLSFADFLIFFERCKAGQYRRDYQHVAARGVNYEFLRTWLDSYAEEREACRSSAYDQFREGRLLPGDETGKDAVQLAKENAEARKRREAYVIRVRSEAAEIRKAWLDELFYTEVIDGYPMEREKPGASSRLLSRFLFEYVFASLENASELTVSTVEELKEQARVKYKGASDDIEASVGAELKAILAELNSFKLAVKPFDLVTRGMCAQNPGKSGIAFEAEVGRLAANFLRETERAYYDEYLPDCIEVKYPALFLEEFLWKAAYVYYRSVSGKNPLLEILNQ